MATEQVMASALGETFARYIEQMRAAWARGQDATLPARAQALLEALLRTAPADEPWLAQLLRERPAARALYRDPDYGFIQMGHSHPAGHSNAPHDHGPCWVLYGVYQGAVEITTYRRTDDGSVPERASLAVQETARLTPGTVRPYLPGDIHAVRTVDPAGAVVLRFLSADLERVERYRYDLATGARYRI